MDQHLVMVKGLIYFSEPQGKGTRSLMHPVLPPLVYRSESRSQTMSDLKDVLERYKNDKV